MDGSLWSLGAASAFFAALHLFIPAGTLRASLVARLGLWGYRGVFSALAIIGLVWMALAYRVAEPVMLWGYSDGARWLAVALMPVAFTLFAGSHSRKSPTAMRAPGAFDPARPGIFAVTRHPMMWSFGLWAILHVLANGDLPSLIFFGTFALVALAGTVAIDRRRRAEAPPGWAGVEASTSNLPFAALLAGRARLDAKGLIRPVLIGLVLWVAILHAHQYLFGMPVIYH